MFTKEQAARNAKYLEALNSYDISFRMQKPIGIGTHLCIAGHLRAGGGRLKREAVVVACSPLDNGSYKVKLRWVKGSRTEYTLDDIYNGATNKPVEENTMHLLEQKYRASGSDMSLLDWANGKIEQQEKRIEALSDLCDKVSLVANENGYDSIAAVIDWFPILAKSRDWKEAVVDQCMVAHSALYEDDPKKTLDTLIDWHVKVALDPQVSSDAQALIDKGKEQSQGASLTITENSLVATGFPDVEKKQRHPVAMIVGLSRGQHGLRWAGKDGEAYYKMAADYDVEPLYKD